LATYVTTFAGTDSRPNAAQADSRKLSPFWPVCERSLAGREDELQTWDDYQYLAVHWRDSIANVRIHDRLGQKPIERFDVEKSCLRSLPAIAYQTDEILMIEVRTTAQIEFDGNRYTVPPRLARPGSAGAYRRNFNILRTQAQLSHSVSVITVPHKTR